ncbi:MAG: RdgB/HAM1 family non-canonical purine NTP pyrophosphatase [Ruminococcaceae bacterium]|nr:RdgB/HAM1 family non-canonical purine NTP pyrophosphatase [Oscillospiraceae bacterium]
MRFVLASNNKGKLIEMKAILSEQGVEVISQREAGLNLEVEENGETFADNAYIKAKAASEVLGLPAISDDSGLCVEALGGAPGVHTARYGGEGLSDEDRYLLLLKNMENAEDRRAKFVSAVVCVMPNGDVISGYGECHGEILYAPKGNGGFGYDPIFGLPEMGGKSMSEITAEEKNAVSHRGKAIEKFREELMKYYSEI